MAGARGATQSTLLRTHLKSPSILALSEHTSLFRPIPDRDPRFGESDLEKESEITGSKLRRKTPAASEARRRSLESRSVIITITCAWTAFSKSRVEKEKHSLFPFEI
jgi:hypothetical protein